MTKWVVIFVAVAIGSFILNDFFGNRSTALFGGQDNSVGEIAGHKVTDEEYNKTLQGLESEFQGRMGRPATERDLVSLREQAWMLLIGRYAISKEYEKVGSEVTTEELYDMIQGRNIEEGLKMNYMDSTGQFDKNRLISDLRAIAEQPAGSPGRAQWDYFRSQLRAARERLKYENLLLNTNYVTKAEAEFAYHVDNDVAEVKYLYIPFYAVKDPEAPVTDADIRRYYDAHKDQYKTDELRSLSYVAFSADPSPKDTAVLRSEMEKLAVQFRETKEDSTFASLNSERMNEAFQKYDILTLPTFLNRETITEGLVLGPFLDNGYYKIAKVTEIGKDTINQAKASHILIRWKSASDEDKKEAKAKATKVLNELKGGANFAAKAMENSEDNASKVRGGDLGWFRQGQMVPEFEKPIMAATKKGLINDIIESQYGYHIINVTETKTNVAYKIALIEKPLLPSRETQDSVYRKADLFASGLSGVEDFKARATEQKLSTYDANDLTASDRFVGNLGEAREMVVWLYRTASVGTVSQIFTIDNMYVVAVMTNEVAAGFRPLDKGLQEQIGVIVKKEVQGKAILAKLDDTTSLEDLAQKFAPDAVVRSASSVKLNNASLPDIGFDPVAVGKAFSVDGGKRTKPFAGESGVVIFEVQNKTVAPGIGDYTIQKTQLLNNLNNNKSSLQIAEAIRDRADIVDHRYKIY